MNLLFHYKRFLVPSAIIFITLFAYIPTLGRDFFFDDDTFLIFNTHITNGIGFFEYFTSHMLQGIGLESGFYRPTQALIFRGLFLVFGLNSFVFHFFQILVHSINAILIYKLLRRLDFKDTISFVSSIVFAIHPVLTQAVSYTSGLADPLYLFFMLLSIHSFITLYRTDKTHYALLTIGFLVLSILSRETGVVGFLILIALYLYLEKNSLFKITKSSATIVVSALISLIYIILRFTLLNFTGDVGLANQTNIYTENLHIRIITFISNIWEYFKLIFFPIDLYYEKPYLAYDSILSLRFLFGLLVLIVSAYLMYRSSKNKTKLWLGIAIFWIFLIPVTGIIPLNAMFLEHWLYGSFIGIVITVAFLLSKIQQDHYKYLYLPIIVIVLLLGVRTYMRNIQWADPILFYENEIRHNDSSARIYNNLAIAYEAEERNDDAIESYERAIELYDIYPQTHYNLANLYAKNGDLDDALQSLVRSLELEPNFIFSHNALATLFERTKQPEKQNYFLDFSARIQNGEKVTFEEVIQVLSIQD